VAKEAVLAVSDNFRNQSLAEEEDMMDHWGTGRRKMAVEEAEVQEVLVEEAELVQNLAE
jgi:hypothetical protein